MQFAWEVLVGTGFFLLLAASGAFAFGVRTGTPTRGIAIPLLFVPIVSDWLRFAAHLSFKTAWMGALLLYAAWALAVYLRLRPSQRNPFRRLDGYWWVIALLLVAGHMFIRTWLFTGSELNPADDTYSGYKTGALYHTLGWHVPFSEAPEVAFNYYYFVYSWPAGLASWFGIRFLPGWWVTAIVFCTVGGLLWFELLRPRIRSWKVTPVIALLLLNGVSFLLLVGVALHKSPGWWNILIREILPQGLYVRLPQQFSGYWGPFLVFSSSTLLVSIHLLLQQWRLRCVGFRFAFVALTIGSLAGYCTFHLVGFTLIFVPLLAWVWLVKLPARKRWPALGSFVALGLLAVLAALPLLLEFSHRVAGSRKVGFHPPLDWLRNPSFAHGPAAIVQAIGAILLMWVVNNPTGVATLFTPTRSRRPLFHAMCVAVFLWGTVVCIVGIADDFALKVGHLVALCGIFIFFQGPWHRGWRWVLLLLALISPLIGIVNEARNNVARPKLDPIWKEIDVYSHQGQLPVYYDLDLQQQSKNDYNQKTAPFFSRAQFIFPSGQIDETGLQFVSDPAALDHLPPPQERLRAFRPEAREYLILSPSDTAPEGELLYRGARFQLSRRSFDPAP